MPSFWGTDAFCEHFRRVHDTMPDRRFCFVLGAGASRSSGVKTAIELVEIWLQDLHLRSGSDKLVEGWVDDEPIVEGLTWKNRGGFYPHIYEARFKSDPEEGYAFLENAMADATPSFGYTVLAQILSGEPDQKPRHNVVVTTNFDNLAADALSEFSRVLPLMCGHESLTGFVKPQLRRPLIAKIHRDLLLGPQSERDEIGQLHEGWQAVLRKIFSTYTPIFVGYGGNDGSLMNFMASLPPSLMPGGAFWCFIGEQPPTDNLIQRFVRKQNGQFVSILGFDEFFFDLNKSLGLPTLQTFLEERASDRLDSYIKEIRKLASKGTAILEEEQVESDELPVEGRQIYEMLAGQVADEMSKAQSRLSRMSRIHTSNTAEELFESYKRDAEKADVLASINNSKLQHFEMLIDFHKLVISHESDPLLKSRSLNARGNNYSALCKFSEATADYRKASSLDPREGLYLANTVLMLCDLNQVNEARATYERALVCEIQATNILSAQGELLLMEGSYEEAERVLNAALHATNQKTRPLTALAYLNVALGRMLEAVTFSRQAATTTASPRVHIVYADVLAQAGDLVSAKREVLDVMAKWPSLRSKVASLPSLAKLV